MAKVFINHPTHEKTVEFSTADITTVATEKGTTLIIENCGTIIRLRLGWYELGAVITNALTRALDLASRGHVN